MLAMLDRRYGEQVRFLGVDVQDTRSAARAFERHYRIRYPSIFDRGASLATELGTFGIPTTYLVDRRGRIAAVLIGRQQRRLLAARLRLLLK